MAQASDLLPEKQGMPTLRWQVFFALAAFVVIGMNTVALVGPWLLLRRFSPKEETVQH